MARIRMAQFGLGPIGIESLRLTAEREQFEIVGGVDIDPSKLGKSIAEVLGLAGAAAAALGDAVVYASFDELVAAKGLVDVVLHTAGSDVVQTLNQIEPMVRAGVSVATTCEPMIYPLLTAPEQTQMLDQLCQASGARVVGTGVNPGFVMEVLPVVLTGVSRRVDSVYAERVVNASTRRMQLQRKIGSGMEPDAFRDLFAAGKAGHAGFQESVALIAHCLGWPLDHIEETCEPVVADHPIETAYFTVAPGKSCGIHQVAKLWVDGQAKVTLDLKMYLDAPNPHDMVRIEGDPPLSLEAPQGIAGDHATVASLVNVAPRLLAAQPGVRLMTELGSSAPVAGPAVHSDSPQPITAGI